MTGSGIPRLVKAFSVFSVIVSLFIFVNNWLITYKINPTALGYDFNGFNNETGLKTAIIPNIVHYVMFGESELTFFSFLSIVSTIKVQEPTEVQIHSDITILRGRYWDLILELSNFSRVPISIREFVKPDLVYGQPLSSVYHASDVARLLILQRVGGIYLDCDTLILKSLKPFLKYEMALGWPQNDYIGTQILIAHKDSRLIKGWFSGYRFYKPRAWYYNAGIFPTELLQHFPHLAHRVPELFGVQNLLEKLHGDEPWTNWTQFYSVHLLARHHPTPPDLDELTILKFNTSFAQIAKWLLYGSDPTFKLFTSPHWRPYLPYL